MENLKHIKVTVRDTGIVIVEFNRPSKRNAFNQAMISEIVNTFHLLDNNDAVRVVIITGGPDRPFCGMYRFVEINNENCID